MQPTLTVIYSALLERSLRNALFGSVALHTRPLLQPNNGPALYYSLHSYTSPLLQYNNAPALSSNTRFAVSLVDPIILVAGTEEQIRKAARDCIDKAGGPGKHLMNLGHGVLQGTPEENVGYFIDECQKM